ncbi:TonB-dependent receptor [Niabella sp. CC-SYL272]|uniref:SusC/RagA family TonB-linked outer membrane protein n=1 Tax=Niabella agricola TaxID=2891571 RepID=UPI001F27024D|nr:TonB-dependent receptor [Niabella agricola]MCF3109872.1 TonB-dependent receptor [Niabella agricola]
MMKTFLLSFMMLLCPGITLFAQSGVEGQVLSRSDNRPLADVNVSLKGTATAVRTGPDGKYRLSVVNTSTAVLVFSHVGFKTYETAVKGLPVLNVFMDSNSTEMNEVVAIGYATVKRKDLTGSISSVTARQIVDIPIASAAEALNGRLAGVQITTSEGAPGAEVKIRIRGGNSITQDNSPMYIVDGIQVEDGLTGLAPQDIESVDVLKDASATAIYGARGANGVIIINTKGGREMKTTVSYNGIFGYNTLANKLEVMSPYEFGVWQWERAGAYATGKHDVYGTWADIQALKNMPAVDWQEKVLNNPAFQQTHNLSVTGGNKATQFNISYTGNNQKGIVLNSVYKRHLLNFRFAHTVSSKLKIGLNTRYNRQEIEGAGTSDAGAQHFNKLRNVVKYRPLIMGDVAEDEIDENYYNEIGVGNGLALINPIALNNAEYRHTGKNLLNLNGFINYNFAKGFTFRSTLGVDLNQIKLKNFDDAESLKGRFLGGGRAMVQINDYEGQTLDFANTLTYTPRLGKGHSLNILAGHEIYNARNEIIDNQVRDFPMGITAEKALAQLSLGIPVVLSPSTSGTESRTVSFFGRSNYSYADKYLLTLTMRADGSSKFSADNRWGYFPSAALAWRISNESFMQQLTFISDMKFRLTYGVAGNNRIQDYLYFSAYRNAGQYNLLETVIPAQTIATLANKDLKWETTRSANIGLDLSLFNNRLQLTADAYLNRTHDLLVNAPIPYNSGYKTQLQNVGQTENKGLEFQLKGVIINHSDFNWNADLNISFNRNKIVKLARQQDFYLVASGIAPSSYPPDFIVKVGQPVGTMIGWISDGFYTVDDFNWSGTTPTLKPGQPDPSSIFGEKAAPGMMKYKDIDGNGIVNLDDQTIIGNPNPKFTGGFNQQLRYKNFDMSVFLNFVYGNDVFNANKMEFTNGYNGGTNLLAIMNDRWKKLDENGNLVTDPVKLAEMNRNTRIWTPKSGSGAFGLNSWAIEDGSFLRVNNITLGYTLPAAITQRAKISKLRFYATVNNLWVITGYTGFDPEVSNRSNGGVVAGVDYAAYPRSRAYLFGVNLSF